METRIHMGRQEGEAALLKELGKAYPHSTLEPLGEAFVRCVLSPEDAQQEPCVAFSSQCVPHAVPVQGESISQLGQAAAQQVLERMAQPQGSWTLHTFCHEYPGSAVRGVRVKKVAQALMETLQVKHRALARAHTVLPGPQGTLVELALHAPNAGHLGVATAEDRLLLRRVLSPFEGGHPPGEEDSRPPSRAYHKLREALRHMELQLRPGETCVDLGAAPGGWTFDPLQAGCGVIAVDRSPLHPDLMRHKRLQFMAGNAFTWKPRAPVDWLLCDVIAFPQQTLELLRLWLREKWCKKFVVTLKFKGAQDYPKLEEAKRLLAHHALDFNIKQLCHNKNEVTAFGLARP